MRALNYKKEEIELRGKSIIKKMFAPLENRSVEEAYKNISGLIEPLLEDSAIGNVGIKSYYFSPVEIQLISVLAAKAGTNQSEFLRTLLDEALTEYLVMNDEKFTAKEKKELSKRLSSFVSSDKATRKEFFDNRVGKYGIIGDKVNAIGGNKT